MRRFISFQILFFIGALATLLLLQLEHTADDPGLGWHLMTGRFIALNTEIPSSDPFLAASEARAWISDQWLSDLLLYGVYQAGGWPLLYTAAILVFLTIYFLLGLPVALKTSSAFAAAFAAFLCFKMGLVHFIIRPVILGLLLFAVQWRLLYQVRLRNPSEEREGYRRLIYLLPPLYALWANLHPSFVMGGLLLGVVLCSKVADRFFLKRPSNRGTTEIILLLLVVCLAATLINPYGYRLHESIFELGRSDFFMNLNVEWRQLDLREPAGGLFQFTFLLLAVAVLVRPDSFSKWGFFEIGGLLLFAHLALISARMLPYFSIFVLPFLAQAVHTLVETIAGWIHLKSFRRSEHTQRSSLFGTFGLVAVILLAVALFKGVVPLYDKQLGPNEKRFPYSAVDYLLRRDAEITVVYSTPNWGGFLTLMGEERIKPVLDDRNTLLGEQPYRDYLAAMKIAPDWQRTISSSGAEFILLPKDEPLARHLTTLSVPLVDDGPGVLFSVEALTLMELSD